MLGKIIRQTYMLDKNCINLLHIHIVTLVLIIPNYLLSIMSEPKYHGIHRKPTKIMTWRAGTDHS
jgi:hypothetical protein